MSEETQNNENLYAELDSALKNQKAGKLEANKQYELLKQLADTNVYDPDRLDKILEFAESIEITDGMDASVENFVKAAKENVILKAGNQKADIAISAANQSITRAEEFIAQAEQTLAQNENSAEPTKEAPEAVAENSAEPTEEAPEAVAENTPEPTEKAPKNTQRNEIPVISQVSYQTYKDYLALKEKENPTPEEQAEMQEIERVVEDVLNNIDEIDEQNAVMLKDYLEISKASGKNDERTSERNSKLEQELEPVLQEYDQENGLEGLDGETLELNEQKWRVIAKEELRVPEELENILRDCPEDARKELGTLALETLVKTSIARLKVNAPSDDQNADTAAYKETFNEETAKYAMLVNAEYLKAKALADYCKQHQITEEDLGKYLQDDKNKKEFEEYLKQKLVNVADYKGPYDDAKCLARAITTANGITVNNLSNLGSRMARLVNAPRVSSQIVKMNNEFAQKNPKLYGSMRTVAAIGKNVLKNAAISAGIGFAFGPVGLTAYSAFKTGRSLYSSYKKYNEQTGDNFLGWCKHLGKRENRAEALALAGQALGTAIAAYWSLGGGLDGISQNLGLVSKLTGHVGDAGAGAAAISGSVWERGVNKIISSPRRAASMASSLGIGMVRGFSEWSNLKHARKELKNIFANNDCHISKDDLRQLEKISDQNELAAKIQEIAPNLSENDFKAVMQNVSLAQKSQPKTAFVSAIGGAALGLAGAAMAEEIKDLQLANVLGGHHDGQDLGGGTTPETGAGNTHRMCRQMWTNTGAAAESLWNGDNAADRRFESFGIDAKNANEMLREMGVIKEGDHHFYRQSELAKLVNESQLSDEQKNTIQDWANDRDARVHNLQEWQREHIHKVAEHSQGAGSQKTSSTLEIPKEREELVTSKTEALNAADKQVETETLEGKTPAEAEQLHKYTFGMKKDGDGKNYSGDAEATSGTRLAHGILDHTKVEKSAKITIVDEDGNKTKAVEHIGKLKDKVSIKEYQDGHKVSYEKSTTYKDASGQEKAVVTYEKRDIDGDGKRDKIYTVKGNGGTTVLTKNHNGDVTVTQTNGNETTTTSCADLEKQGMSHKSAKAKLLDIYKKFTQNVK